MKRVITTGVFIVVIVLTIIWLFQMEEGKKREPKDGASSKSIKTIQEKVSPVKVEQNADQNKIYSSKKNQSQEKSFGRKPTDEEWLAMGINPKKGEHGVLKIKRTMPSILYVLRQYREKFGEYPPGDSNKSIADAWFGKNPKNKMFL